MTPSGATLEHCRTRGGRPRYTAPATLMIPLRPGARGLFRLVTRLTSRFRSEELERLSILHFAEWGLCIRPPRTIPGRHLAGSFLFLSDFDGDTDDYIVAFARGPRRVFKLLFWWSAGYPGVANSGALLAYIRRFLHHSPYWYSAYPDATLKDVRAALALAPRLDALCGLGAGDTGAFDGAYRALVRDQVQHGALPATAGLPCEGHPGPPAGTFTCLVPLEPGTAETVTAELDDHQRRTPAALDDVAGTHFARFAVVDRLFDRANQLLPLDPSYLLFSAQFDLGPDRREYVDRLCTTLLARHPGLAQVWRHGEKSPLAPDDTGAGAGTDTARALADYLAAHRVTPGLFVTGNPEPATVTRIRSALHWAERFERFVIDTDRGAPGERHAEFRRRFVARRPHIGGEPC